MNLSRREAVKAAAGVLLTGGVANAGKPSSLILRNRAGALFGIAYFSTPGRTRNHSRSVDLTVHSPYLRSVEA